MTGPPRRVLVSTFGSAGDLFPLVPLIQGLRQQGHDVRCAVPRALSLYLRSHGIPVVALGDGQELKVLGDQCLATTRSDGWASWRRVVDHYVAATLRRDVESLDRALATWTPDVVVTATFAAAARIVARRRGLPHLSLSIYPQINRRLVQAHGYARRYRHLCAELAGLDPTADGDAADLAALVWGVGPSTVLLHDPALLAYAGSAAGNDMSLGPARAAGFPYWDEGPEKVADVAVAERWASRAGASGSRVVVTLGSFLGVAQHEELGGAVAAAAASGARVLLVGPGARQVADASDPHEGVTAVGFVRMARLAGRADVVLHHGGIGTLFACLRAGTPMVIVPQAFDQPFNARMASAAGVGTHGGAGGLSIGDALDQVLADHRFRDRAGEISTQLRSTDEAVDSLAGVVEATAAGDLAVPAPVGLRA